MTKSNTLIEKMNKHSAHNYKPLPIVLEKGEGVWVWDVDGKKYMDMLSAYSALNHGHRHPKIVDRAKKQLDKIALCSRAFHAEKLAQFCERITNLTKYDMVLPMNSGAEAVETALKLIRKWAYVVKKIPKYEAEIIVCSNNFHGRTVTIVSFSSDADYRDSFGPFTPGFKIIPYGDIEALKKAITPKTAAFLVEPIQGEAGILMPAKGYLEAAQKICKENNVLTAFDEIQTGLGRTGKLFCHMWENVRPDILIVGKALGGGIMPISAVLADEPILGLFTPGEHGSTFGGNPLACECALAAMDVLEDEHLIQRSQEMGEYLMGKLRDLNSPYVKEIRGKGLLVGIELKKEAGGARKFCEALMARGLLCKETHEHVIRLAPPLVITKEEIDWAVQHVKDVLK
ncbi:MAG: ornithine--oxo-acid transaminase [Proteobacteria bacterium]|nr:ornithine--oxo-acid transaminase [Pseudomonadota bacterium]